MNSFLFNENSLLIWKLIAGLLWWRSVIKIDETFPLGWRLISLIKLMCDEILSVWLKYITIIILHGDENKLIYVMKKYECDENTSKW